MQTRGKECNVQEKDETNDSVKMCQIHPTGKNAGTPKVRVYKQNPALN